MGKEYFSTQIKQDLLGYVYTKDLICFQIKKKKIIGLDIRVFGLQVCLCNTRVQNP